MLFSRPDCRNYKADPLVYAGSDTSGLHAHGQGKRPQENTVIFRHGLRNALIPLITFMGMYVSTLLGGSAIIEQVFSIPGMGSLLMTSVSARDFPVIQTCVLLMAAFSIMINLIVDILYGYIDPRIRLN